MCRISRKTIGGLEPAVPYTDRRERRLRPRFIETRRARPPSSRSVGADVPGFAADLHVYAVRPGDRYALINMHRVHEGDVLPEGARVLPSILMASKLTYQARLYAPPAVAGASRRSPA